MKQLYIKYLFLFFYINLPTFIDEEPEFITIKFDEGNCRLSGTCVRESKLYCTEEEAKKVGEQHQNAKVIHN